MDKTNKNVWVACDPTLRKVSINNPSGYCSFLNLEDGEIVRGTSITIDYNPDTCAGPYAFQKLLLLSDPHSFEPLQRKEIELRVLIRHKSGVISDQECRDATYKIRTLFGPEKPKIEKPLTPKTFGYGSR